MSYPRCVTLAATLRTDYVKEMSDDQNLPEEAQFFNCTVRWWKD